MSKRICPSLVDSLELHSVPLPKAHVSLSDVTHDGVTHDHDGVHDRD